MRYLLIGVLLLASAFTGGGCLFAQNPVDNAALVITKQGLRNTVNALTDTESMGRASGSDGIDKARRHIISEFYNAGIEMAGESYSYGFYFWAGRERILGINIVGMIPAGKSVENPKTILIGAHYDGLGVLGGKIYPGADNNASGVAAMIEIGKAFAELSRQGNAPDCNICLVAFDASNLECEGSLKLLSDKIIEPSDISLMINLDQIGTTLAPPDEAKTDALLPKNYLLFLGMDKTMESVRSAFTECNSSGEPLVLDFTYYGNKQIHDMLNDMGDQIPFRKAGIPSIVITSGIHKYTNKTADKADIINFNALTERCKLIFRTLCKLTKTEIK